MFRVCKKLNAKGTKAKSKFKVKLLNLVNLERDYLSKFIHSKFSMISPLEKPTFENHLKFQLQMT